MGSKKQAEYWGKRLVGNRLGGKRGFLRIEAVGADGAHYYQLKNLGVQHSTGEIVAFIDSDALPNADWLRRIATGITSGAAVVAGITLFRWENGSRRFAGFLTAAASISWGFIVGDPPRGFLSHNAAFRRVDFERIRYREDLGRTCAGSFLHESLIQQELPIRFQPEQRVYHAFNFRWWITRLHVRFGHEVHLLRRLNPQARHRWVRRLGPLEPLASMAWHMALDLPQWFRFSKARMCRWCCRSRWQRAGRKPWGCTRRCSLPVACACSRYRIEESYSSAPSRSAKYIAIRRYESCRPGPCKNQVRNPGVLHRHLREVLSRAAILLEVLSE